MSEDKLQCDMVQVKFFEVSEEELEKQRAAFATGQLQLEVHEEQFDMGAYNSFLAGVAPETDKLKQQQQAAAAKQVSLLSCCLESEIPKACTLVYIFRTDVPPEADLLKQQQQQAASAKQVRQIQSVCWPLLP